MLQQRGRKEQRPTRPNRPIRTASTAVRPIPERRLSDRLAAPHAQHDVPRPGPHLTSCSAERRTVDPPDFGTLLAPGKISHASGVMVAAMSFGLPKSPPCALWQHRRGRLPSTDDFDAAYRRWQPMVERSLAWLTRGMNRKLRYRGVERNQLWWSHRCAAVNLQRLVTLGLAAGEDGT